MKWKRWLLLLTLYALLLLAGWAAGNWVPLILETDAEDLNGSTAQMMLMTTAGIFILVSALPFVPGAEIGLGLMMLLGTKVLLLVYGCMVTALTLSYLVGRFVPATATAATFRFFRLMKASQLALDMAPLPPRKRLDFLMEQAPKHVLPFMLKHRHLALFIVLNIPGNTVIGGGGGIAFIAGISGIYSFPAYLLTLLLAVAPLPLLFLITASAF
ncbi:MAG: hypothetical protein COB93_06475 [Sneathiella sp.]|nr:MAG: hypothetical protein COB93_06475 [Sneathiella sp.]